MKLKNKVVIITGANSGIGECIAKRFASEGANLVIAARRLDKLNKISKEITDKGGKVLVVRTDVRKESDLENLIRKTIETFDTIDILINNAGIAPHKEIDNFTVEEYDDVMNTNLRSAFITSHLVAPIMKKKKSGAIINISSVAGKKGYSLGSVYCASKFGMIGLTEALADELNEYNINVTAICPGLVNTPLFNYSPKEKKKMINTNDVAEIAVYLATLPTRVKVIEFVMVARHIS